MEIDWSTLQKNLESEELSFESFNFQIAWSEYSRFGVFEYDYNTPGAEFFLTLKEEYPELELKPEDVIGWQAKFWVNHNDMNNTRMGSGRRQELKEGIEKTFALKPNLKAWFICTPGQILTGPREKLEADLQSIIPDLKVIFWSKQIYETFYHADNEKYNSIFAHYFSSKYIGYEFLKFYTQMRINRLSEKFDTDLYVESSINEEIELILNYKKQMSELSAATHGWQDNLKYSQQRCENYISKIDEEDEYSVYLSKLLKFLIGFSNEFHSEFYVYEDSKNILNALRKLFRFVHEKLGVLNKLIKGKNIGSASEKDKRTPEAQQLDIELNTQFRSFDRIYDLYRKFLQSEIHIFGKAGYGKTNLACAIAEKNLKDGIPSLLLLATDIKVDSNIPKWITDSLEIQYNFSTLLGFLNNLGFFKQCKISVIIDGLNEKYPNAAIWQSELSYLRQHFKKFRNVILITTSRESYINEIFNKSSYKEVPNNYYLEGFDQYNQNIAIRKYLEKYNITIQNDDYDKGIFQNPLLLKIFCIVHKNRSFIFYPENIYETMESYYKYLIDKIAMDFPSQKPIISKIIEERIDNFCSKLLVNRLKHATYQTDFFSIFDPDYEPSTESRIIISERILDEGMFIKRGMHNGQEVVEFTHDFIGGYSIAKAIAYDKGASQNIQISIQNPDLMQNVIDLKSGEFLHPLSEDILRNLIYFYKKETGGQLFNVLKFDSVLKLSLSMLEVVNLSKEESDEVIDTLLSTDNKDLLLSFFETALLNIIDKNDYCYLYILVKLIQKMPANEIDLFWSENIRKHSPKIFRYLRNITVNNKIPRDKMHEVSHFIPCLFSSTHRMLRDIATKALVNLGGQTPELVFTSYKEFENVSDLYITERIISAICGIILRSKNCSKEHCLKIAEYLEIKYLKEHFTTHLLILDYVDTILHYVSYQYGYERKYVFSPDGLEDWPKDSQCAKALTGDGKATWGYGPIRMDFAKYTIGHHIAAYGYSDNKTPTLKEVMAMIIWRMKELGYDENTFEEIDKECAKARHDYSRHDNSGSIERYGKKYSWIAYFELYGQFVFQGKIETEAQNSFRVSSVDIDPTFPRLPKKEQLIATCYLPRRNDDIQAWVNKDEQELFRNIYKMDTSDGTWVLLNSNHYQKGSKIIRIDISVNAVLVPVKKKAGALDVLNNSGLSITDYNIEEYYYLFNGEIPFGKIIQSKAVNESFNDSNRPLFFSPYSWYSWESYHSITNDIGNVPFLAKSIVDEFNLRYDIQSLTFFDKDEPCTKYYHDNNSHYLFIKEKHIRQFLEKHNLVLIWYEFVAKNANYGSFDKSDLDPSYNRFSSAKILDW